MLPRKISQPEAEKTINILEPTMEYYLAKNNEIGNHERYGFFICICNHPSFIHSRWNIGPCSFLYCKCLKFVEKEFVIAFNILERDVFEYEIKDHSKRDSLSYFNEFNSWKKKEEQYES